MAGIVNITPDSFHDGGQHADTALAVAWARRLLAEGAHILDLGGESTRPGATAIDAAEEQRRVLPVVAACVAMRGHHGAPAVVAVDTWRAETARLALEAGAVMVNDISGARFDPALVEVLAQYRPGYVLMHAQGRPGTMQADPRYHDVVAEVRAFFEERLAVLTRAGLPESHIVLDPGIGFGKTLDHNLTLLRRVGEFASLGRPLYLGLSHKSWLGKLLGLETGQRAMATQVATALMAAKGVWIHRVHDVADTVRSLRLTEALA